MKLILPYLLLLSACPFAYAQTTYYVPDDFSTIQSGFDGSQNGDTVIVIKNLPVKGAPAPIKAGTKVKNIRLTDGDHNISCRIDGFGSMQLKSEFVRKA
jgi:protein PhnA